MALREEVLVDLHEGVCTAHLRMDKTLARLKERFYWPGHYTMTWITGAETVPNAP